MSQSPAFALLPGDTPAAPARFALQSVTTRPDSDALWQLTAGCDENNYGRLRLLRFNADGAAHTALRAMPPGDEGSIAACSKR